MSVKHKRGSAQHELKESIVTYVSSSREVDRERDLVRRARTAASAEELVKVIKDSSMLNDLIKSQVIIEAIKNPAADSDVFLAAASEAAYFDYGYDSSKVLIQVARKTTDPAVLSNVVVNAMHLGSHNSIDSAGVITEILNNAHANSDVFLAAASGAAHFNYSSDGSKVLIQVARKTTDPAVLSNVVVNAMHLGSHSSGDKVRVITEVLNNAHADKSVLFTVLQYLDYFRSAFDIQDIAAKVMANPHADKDMLMVAARRK